MFQINKISVVGRLAGVHFPGRAIGFKAPQPIEAKTPSAHGWFVLRLFELAKPGKTFENGLAFQFEDVYFMCSYGFSGRVENLKLNSLVSVEAELSHLDMGDGESTAVPVLTEEIKVLAPAVKAFGPYASPLGLRFYGKDGYEIKLNPDGRDPQKITRIGDMPAPRVRAMGAAKTSMTTTQIATAVERSEARQVLAKQMKRELAKIGKQPRIIPSGPEQSSLFDASPVLKAKNDPSHKPGDKGFLDRDMVESLVDTKDFPL